jgi:glycosyltransferase involved in cell wall biosynthesis
MTEPGGSIRVAVAGATGWAGSALVHGIAREPDLVLVSFVQLLRAAPDVYRALRDRLHVGIRSHWEVRTLHGPELAVAREAAGVWACNAGLAREAQEAIGRPVVYRHDGVPCDAYTPALRSPEQFTVGWSGNASLLEKQWPVARLVGDAVEMAGGRFVACGRGAPGLSCLPLQMMPGWFRGLSTYICTSSEDGGPNGPLEAAACGVPTVSFRCGAMPEFLGASSRAGILVRDAPEMIAELCAWMCHSPEEREEQGRLARARAEEWSLDAWAQDFLRDMEAAR